MRLAVYRRDSLQAMERAAQALLPPHTLMQRAGLALYQFLCQRFPQAERIWFICGAGNNGGDALVAARHWQQEASARPRSAFITQLGTPLAAQAPDAAWAYALAQGLRFCQTSPGEVDVIVDAIWGLGFRAEKTHPAQTSAPAPRAPHPLLEPILQHLRHIARERQNGAAHLPAIVAVDVPSGLDAQSGLAAHALTVRADYTLAMLAHKVGCFMSDGLDYCGQLHLATLDLASTPAPCDMPVADAWVHQEPPALLPARSRNSHKGVFGNVCIVGGAGGMGGALLLAASAALSAGAGRVWALSLDAQAPTLYESWPEIMLRPWTAPESEHAHAATGLPDWAVTTVLCGCGAGQQTSALAALMHLIPHAARLVLDADALNCLAVDVRLQNLLQQRAQRHPEQLILTPHPLEAARLLACDVATVQDDRLNAAQKLADTWQAVCVLKGAGTVIAAPNAAQNRPPMPPQIWPVGNAKLAQAGSGDVLAGYLAAVWATLCGQESANSLATALQAAAWAVSVHGHVAQTWSQPHLRASDLARAMGRWPRYRDEPGPSLSSL